MNIDQPAPSWPSQVTTAPCISQEIPANQRFRDAMRKRYRLVSLIRKCSKEFHTIKSNQKPGGGYLNMMDQAGRDKELNEVGGRLVDLVHDCVRLQGKEDLMRSSPELKEVFEEAAELEKKLNWSALM